MIFNRIKYISIKGHPMVQFIFDEPVYSYSYNPSNPANRRIKKVEENILQMPIASLYDFFRANEEVCGKWINSPVDKDSIKRYYGYVDGNGNDRFTTKLTQKFLDNWANYDHPTLSVYIPNTEDDVNGLGIYIPEFSYTLIDYRWDGVDVGEMTEEEYQLLSSGLNYSGFLYKRIKESWYNQKSTKNVDEILERVKKYESLINDEIEKYANELSEYKKTLPDVPFDCGFATVKTKNELINQDIRFLISKDVRITDALEVKLPENYFSVSNTKQIFNKLKDLSRLDIFKDLYLITRLD